MILADVNVLVYAFRRDMPRHASSKRWLDGVVSNEAAFGMSPLALNAVIRVTTDRRVFKEPSTTDEVFRFCDNLLGQPHCQIVAPGERHWGIFQRLCRATDTRGARVTDAWFAALAIEWGCRWVTFDRDYARFPGLTWSPPE